MANELRHDTTTSYYIAEGLRLQSDYGFNRANLYLQIVGMPPKTAAQILAIRSDRRIEAVSVTDLEAKA